MNLIMFEKEFFFVDLFILLFEFYEVMGYVDVVFDEVVEKEVCGVFGWVEVVIFFCFCFFIFGGELDELKDLFFVGDMCFSIGKIIIW